MRKTQQKDQKLSFQHWYRSLPHGEVLFIRNLIITECLLKRSESGRCPVFENWRDGNTQVPPLAQLVINDIAEQELDYSISETVLKATA